MIIHMYICIIGTCACMYIRIITAHISSFKTTCSISLNPKGIDGCHRSATPFAPVLLVAVAASTVLGVGAVNLELHQQDNYAQILSKFD